MRVAGTGAAGTGAAGVKAAEPKLGAQTDRRAVGLWLLICCGLIFAMVVIGGITRLTESGLSIVRWEPIGGAIPPLTERDWQTEFDLYKASPQYQQVNRGMSLEEFKGIFWWEWIHRQWGRLIGLAFALPLAWFLIRRKIGPELRWPLFGLLVLGGFQGAIGWWMVASGLKDVPWVSTYRLATHLGTALVIYSIALWLGLSLLRGGGSVLAATEAALGLRRFGRITLGLLAATILMGAFVAGLDAGMIYNEFPFMGDGLIPPDYRNPALGWLANGFENHAAVQFHHRVLATATLLAAGGFGLALMLRGPTRMARMAGIGIILAVLGQYALGIMTLLAQVPVSLGAAHQGGAVVLLTALLIGLHGLRQPVTATSA